jgi:hypothetical protein
LQLGQLFLLLGVGLVAGESGGDGDEQNEARESDHAIMKPQPA